VPSEEDRVLADLHWLIQDGYVVEFSNGRLWALADKPPQPPPTSAVAPPENAEETATETAAEAVATIPTAVADEPSSSPAPAQAATGSAEPTSTTPASS